MHPSDHVESATAASPIGRLVSDPPSSRLARWLVASGSMRSQLERICLGLAFVLGGAAVPIVVTNSSRDVITHAVGAVAFMSLTLLWARDRSSRRTSGGWLVLEATCLILAGRIVPPDNFLDLLYAGVLFRFADGNKRRSIAVVATYEFSLITVLAVGKLVDGSVPPLSVVVQAPAMVMIGVLVHHLALMLGGADRAHDDLAVALEEKRAREDDMRSLLDMSSALAQTLDSRQVGDLVARHMAVATRMDQCSLTYWESDTDRLVTYGRYPNGDVATAEETYQLSDYPETRRVVVERTPSVVSGSDPSADPHELAHLDAIGGTALAIIPMVVNRRSIGAVEIVSETLDEIDGRVLALAQTMAGEAAMALENARLYEQLRHQAYHDGLTGLANRALLRDRLDHALRRRERSPEGWLAILFLDLDDFKMVNDRFGHGSGDRLLVAVAEEIQASLRPGDTVARLGGDEFAILLEDIPDPAEAELVARRIVESLSRPIALGGDEVVEVGASIGLVVSGGEPTSVEMLLRDADAAMYRAKKAGKGRYEVFGRKVLRTAAHG